MLVTLRRCIPRGLVIVDPPGPIGAVEMIFPKSLRRAIPGLLESRGLTGKSIATELGTTWPLLRKAFTRHGLGMPARNPEAVHQRAIAAARQRSGQPAPPPLDLVFVTLNPDVLPGRPRSQAELFQ
jgi:hypothetical protein